MNKIELAEAQTEATVGMRWGDLARAALQSSMDLLAARLASTPAAPARPRRPGSVRRGTGAAGISQDNIAENVRYQGQHGNHLLVLSFTSFDSSRTLGEQTVNPHCCLS
jgi:hypothetical protein